MEADQISLEERVQCIKVVQRKSKVHDPIALLAMSYIENGKKGSFNRNSNGTYDMGLMQINTTNMSLINKEFPLLSRVQLAYNTCVNIFISNWFLNLKIKETNGDLWKGVGNYHSKTPKFHWKYRRKVFDKYLKLIGK